MDEKGLRSRIDNFEDTFRALIEGGLFIQKGAPPAEPPPARSPLLDAFAGWLLLCFSVRELPAVPPRDAATPASRPRSAQIGDAVQLARSLVDEKQLPRAAAALAEGEAILQSEIFSHSLSWRLVRIHQLPIFLYYLVWLVGLGLLAAFPTARGVSSLWGVPASMLALGALGAVLRGLYWLQVQVSRRNFRAQFVLAHFAAPTIGALLATGAYLLAVAGLFTLEVTDPTKSAGLDHGLLIRAIAFLAGFNWTWFLNRLTSGVFGSGSTAATK